MTVKFYIFKLETRGFGKTPEEAWKDAAETIASQLSEYLDPSDPLDWLRGTLGSA
ncbi:MAG TPA: hypothetical protein VH682_13845 [Gemmataceae bacterium]|jgi:hypothetical protein